jgi:DMSO/TMAO reductase YedYZ molybdopterin-dependent catalytic subunit
MVFSELHWIPSVLAAVFTILLAFVKDKSVHNALSYAMAFFALIGLLGYISQGSFNLLSFNIHALHAWLGTVALLLSLYTFIDGLFFKKKASLRHCRIGYIAAVFAFIALLIGGLLLSGLVSLESTQLSTFQNLQVPTSSTLPEVEAKEFLNITLTPLSNQGNNAIKGTQYLNESTYRLRVKGLVDKELNMSYGELLNLPAYSEVAYMPCVDGWGFTAKWTGFRVVDLLDLAGLKPSATYVVFYCSDGYSTGLPLDYLRNNKVLMAYGINDLTLPPDRGFPFQLVAINKYGYKWAKWIISIEVGSKEVQGYWESRGYSNNGDVGSSPLGEFSSLARTYLSFYEEWKKGLFPFLRCIRSNIAVKSSTASSML